MTVCRDARAKSSLPTRTTAAQSNAENAPGDLRAVHSGGFRTHRDSLQFGPIKAGDRNLSDWYANAPLLVTLALYAGRLRLLPAECHRFWNCA